MTKRHTCLFFSSMIFLSFKGLIMSTFLSAFGGNARTSQEDKLKQLLQCFTTKLALSTQYPHCHQDKLRPPQQAIRERAR